MAAPRRRGAIASQMKTMRSCRSARDPLARGSTSTGAEPWTFCLQSSPVRSERWLDVAATQRVLQGLPAASSGGGGGAREPAPLVVTRSQSFTSASLALWLLQDTDDEQDNKEIEAVPFPRNEQPKDKDELQAGGGANRFISVPASRYSPRLLCSLSSDPGNVSTP